MNIKRMTRISLFASMLAISVYLIPPIQVPFVEVSFTLQTMLVVLIGFLLTPLEAFLAILVYIMVGALGIPVFSGARGGLSVLFGPSGGFLMMFPFVSLGISYFKSDPKKIGCNLIIAFVFGIVLLYLFANVYLSLVLNLNYWIALLSLLPFIPFDMVKIVLAYLVYRKIPKDLFE
jgi:biotin transport system substrate-specific component